MFYSPLRYPGGKGKLEPFMELLIRQTGHLGGTYVEPFAGGAGIALELLESKLAIGTPPTNQQIHTDRPPLNCRD